MKKIMSERRHQKILVIDKPDDFHLIIGFLNFFRFVFQLANFRMAVETKNQSLTIEYALGIFEVLLDVDSFVADFEMFFSDEFVGIIVEFGVW